MARKQITTFSQAVQAALPKTKPATAPPVEPDESNEDDDA